MTMSQGTIRSGVQETIDAGETGVAWPAIFGGALATIGITVAAVPLGIAVGFAFAPPWHSAGEEARAMTLLGVVWLIAIQWISSGVGGYLTGRLRSAIAGAHTHEVFFRDTVHGFLAWVLATLVTVILAGSLGDLGVQMAHRGPGGPMMSWSPEGRASEKLLRGETATDPRLAEASRQEIASILMAAGPTATLDDEDKTELSELVATRSGVSATEASARVDQTLTWLRNVKAAHHKAMVSTAICAFLSLWIGALIATAAAALGGQHRDIHYATGRLI